MLLLLYLMVLTIGFIAKVPRKWYWLVCAVVLCLLVNTSESYADLENYTNIFNAIGNEGLAYSGTIPFGWIVLCLFFYKIGFSYRGMIVFIILFCMFLIHYSLKDYSISEGRFWALFLVFPGLLQCVQVRFFLGTSIVFFALRFISEKGKKGLLQYIIGIVLATLIHASCVIFMAYAVIALFEKINFRKVMTLSVVLSLAVAVFKNYLLSFISMLGIISQERLNRYFYDGVEVSSISWIVIIAVTHFACVTAVWFFKRQTKQPVLLENSAYIQEAQPVLNRMMSFVCLLTFTLPLLLFDSSMYRFIQVGMYVTFCLAGWYWENGNRPYREKFIATCILFIPLSVVLLSVAPINTVLGPFFTFSGFHSLLR